MKQNRKNEKGANELPPAIKPALMKLNKFAPLGQLQVGVITNVEKRYSYKLERDIQIIIILEFLIFTKLTTVNEE